MSNVQDQMRIVALFSILSEVVKSRPLESHLVDLLIETGYLSREVWDVTEKEIMRILSLVESLQERKMNFKTFQEELWKKPPGKDYLERVRTGLIGRERDRLFYGAR